MLQTIGIYGFALGMVVLKILSEAAKEKRRRIDDTERRWNERNGANAKYMKQLRAKEREKNRKPGALSIGGLRGGELSAPVTTKSKKGRVSHV